MKCPNCGREEPWEDASFCPKCGKQLISIIMNVLPVREDIENKKIRLQIYQIMVWIFLTAAAFLYVSKVIPTSLYPSPWGEFIPAVIDLVVSGIGAWFVMKGLLNEISPQERKMNFF